ncbi:hypothetical protein [Vallicoccus soli]|uniref:Uncharacterized protein n=1 Tax=Vallicoccus soli TaxID=2339232 RepID=A0A3A3ZLZ4_9ACTN|nr:hypothetical protein [Vallicoccus soli]RJK97521.1 hypothetical protein D5H78_00275 [Vallicoccus soli]
MSYVLEPEVAGGLGERTVWDRTGPVPRVTALHYEVDQWLGDDLLESHPCFLATEALARAVDEAGLTGVAWGAAEVTTSDVAADLAPHQRLPPLRWLQPVGEAGRDDVALDGTGRLLCSDAAMDVLRGFHLENCLVEPQDAAL